MFSKVRNKTGPSGHQAEGPSGYSTSSHPLSSDFFSCKSFTGAHPLPMSSVSFGGFQHQMTWPLYFAGRPKILLGFCTVTLD